MWGSPQKANPTLDYDLVGLNLVQQSGCNIKHESTNRILMHDERVALDASDRLTNILVKVGERLGGPFRLDANFVLDALLEVIVGEGEHATVGVVNQDDFFGTEQSLANGERTDFVIGHDSAGITDNV